MILFVFLFAIDMQNASFMYDREALIKGEYYRFVTAHFLHAEFFHLLYACGIFALFFGFWPRTICVGKLVLLILFLSTFISFGLFVFYPEIQWYLGSSGIIYGLLVPFVSARYGTQTAIALSIVSLLFIFSGITPGGHFEGHRVIIEAHGFGILGGLIHLALGHIFSKKLFIG
jgi:rhomboid family GlyGly-CTERM serine protease